jgi:photosystem II stability/assembly factor-like uncharacterized protein
MEGNVKKGLARAISAFFLCAFLFSTALPAQTLNEDSLKGMKWRLVGPFRGGRVLAVSGVPNDANTYYFGAVAGGVWKTTNGGITWTPLFDKEPVSSIGAIAVAPSDPNVIYVGTGEACIRGNISFGDGMYKSVDAGKTWSHIGLDDSRHIARIAVDPRNPDVVFVAALGHAWGPNSERGLYRSTDGGKTWQKVIFVDDKTGAVDISFDPSNSHILYASMWQAMRTPWHLDSGGPGSAIYKSTDEGATWKKLEGHGLPKGPYGRIGVAAAPGGAGRVYALIEAESGGLFRSDNAGESWHKLTDDHRFTQRAWYFTHIFADTKNPDVVYILNTGMYRSTDAGKSFSAIRAPHGDRHGLWIDPENPARMIEGDDGGATITTDGGNTWTRQDNQPTAQFYHVATDNQFLYHIYGAQQDNSTVSIASRSDDGAITQRDWYDVGGGESGFVVPDPRNPNIVYAGSYDGLITRFDKSTGQTQEISAWPLNPMGYGAANLVHRFQWTAPIALSPHDPNVIYHGGEVLFKSTDNGMSWTAISPDLTRNDKSKQQSSGGPITQDNTSVEYYDTIFAAAESPLEKGLIWVGTDDGLVQITRDAGAHWSNVTPKSIPDWSTISLIDPSPHDAGTAYVAVDRHRLDDFHPYIFKTTDYGKQWAKLTAGIPDTAYVHAVREDPKRRGLLYAGTETGIYVSFDDGAHWQSLQLNLPQSPIHDLTVHNDDLIVATHGRSFWVLDNINPLRQLNDKIQAEDVHFFTPALSYRTRIFSFHVPPGMPAGQNPPSGVVLDYSLKEAPKDAVKLEILDSQGKVIRKYSTKKPKEQEAPDEGDEFDFGHPESFSAVKGLNRFVWDMRYEPATKVPGLVTWGGSGNGPLALPGKYEARLTLNGKEYKAPIEIKEDPRVSVSEADLRKQLDLALKIRDRLSEAHKAVNEMRDIHNQLEALKKRLASDDKAKDIVSAADTLNKKLEALESSLVQPKSKSGEDPLNFPIQVADQLQALGSTVGSSDNAPTQSDYTVFDQLSQKIGEHLASWEQLQKTDLSSLNEKIRSASIPAIAATPPKED